MPYEYDEKTPLVEGELEYEDITEKKEGGVDEEHYELPASLKARTRVWSVISITLGILSVLLCPFYYVSLVLAVAAAVTAVVSQKLLGYFDRLALVGLITGIIGVVFGAFSLIVDVTGVLDALKK